MSIKAAAKKVLWEKITQEYWLRYRKNYVFCINQWTDVLWLMQKETATLKNVWSKRNLSI